MMNYKVIFLIIVFILTAFVPQYSQTKAAAALMPVSERLFETETEHFYIIFQESLQGAVPYIALHCEDAYKTLTGIFNWRPAEKIEVLFADSMDTHNGWGTAIPHNRMFIYAAGAEPGSSIFQNGNYLRRTIFHELTHVLNMDMRFGYNRVISGIFGKMMPVTADPLSSVLFYLSLSPLTLAPTWYLEGTAIWSESRFAPPGRVGASIPEMIFRSSVDENNLLSYSRWDLDYPYWPYGLGAYLYGMKLIDYIYETSSKEEAVGELAWEIAHAFMFNFDVKSRAVAGKRFKHLAYDMLSHEKIVQRQKLNSLSVLPFTRIPRLTKHGMIVTQPVFAGNNIYFNAHEEEERDSLYLYDTDRKSITKIKGARTTSAFGSLSADRDGRYVYYTKLGLKHKDNYFYEIRCLDTKTKKDSRITAKGRFRAIDISPCGKMMAAATMRQGRGILIEIPLSGIDNPEAQRVLWSGALQDDISSPRYSSDGKKIVFSISDANGFALVVLDVDTGREVVLYKCRGQILFPAWLPGDASIIFSSDKNGVFNLYEISSKAGVPRPVTHVPGGVFACDISPDGKNIAAVCYDSKGYYLSLIPYTGSLAQDKLPDIRPVSAQNPVTQKGIPDNNIKDRLLVRPYNSFLNINYDYFSPWLTASNEEAMGGIGALFSDPASYQDIYFLAGYETRYKTPVGIASYGYHGLYPDMQVYMSQEQFVYPDLLFVPGGSYYDYTERVREYGAMVEVPFDTIDINISFQAGYQHIERDFIDGSDGDYKYKIILTPDISQGAEGSVWARINFFDGTAFKRSISVQDGRLIALTAERTAPVFGGRISRTRCLTEWHEYIDIPFLRDHVFKLSAVYGYSKSGETAQGAFGLGGYGDPVNTISPGMPRSIMLRGYDENFQTGREIIKLSSAYRFPFVNLFRGIGGSFPFYFRQIFAEFFYDGGRTWSNNGLGDDLRWLDAMGLELNLSCRILRFLNIAPGIGFAYAPDRYEGDDDNDDERYQAYITVKGVVNF